VRSEHRGRPSQLRHPLTAGSTRSARKRGGRIDLGRRRLGRGRASRSRNGSRLERLPLPRDVGKALAAYLRCDRPRCCTTRRLFVRAKAPVVGFASAAAISTIVADAIARTALDPPSRGAHLLRYSLATAVHRRGGSLAEIAELLRHRHSDTTALYAKVDLEALRSVAPVWPGAHR
jgi:integrase/recombinase XerD